MEEKITKEKTNKNKSDKSIKSIKSEKTTNIKDLIKRDPDETMEIFIQRVEYIEKYSDKLDFDRLVIESRKWRNITYYGMQY